MYASLVELVLALELLYTTCSIDDLLTSCEERMALVADIDAHLWLVGLHFKSVTTCTCYFALYILWMYIFSHFKTLK